MEVLSAEQIVTVSVMCLWFLFPVGMFLSVWRQQHDEKRPAIPTKPKRTLHVVPRSTFTYEEEDDDIDDTFGKDDFDYARVPKKDPGTETHHPNT